MTGTPSIRISSSPVTSAFASFIICPPTVTPPFFRTAFTSLRLPAPAFDRYLSSLMSKHLQYLSDLVSSRPEYFIRQSRPECNEHVDECTGRYRYCEDND